MYPPAVCHVCCHFNKQKYIKANKWKHVRVLSVIHILNSRNFRKDIRSTLRTEAIFISSTTKKRTKKCSPSAISLCKIVRTGVHRAGYISWNSNKKQPVLRNSGKHHRPAMNETKQNKTKVLIYSSVVDCARKLKPPSQPNTRPLALFFSRNKRQLPEFQLPKKIHNLGRIQNPWTHSVSVSLFIAPAISSG